MTVRELEKRVERRERARGTNHPVFHWLEPGEEPLADLPEDTILLSWDEEQ